MEIDKIYNQDCLIGMQQIPATKSMRKARKLHKAIDKVLKCNNELISALSVLSRIASDIYGQDIEATICNGDEIEFRRNGDALDCLLASDIVGDL